MKSQNRNSSFHRLASLIDENGYTVARVAREAGIPPSTLYDWKAGKYIPKYANMAKIAKVFGVTPEYLQNGSSDGNAVVYGKTTDKNTTGIKRPKDTDPVTIKDNNESASLEIPEPPHPFEAGRAPIASAGIISSRIADIAYNEILDWVKKDNRNKDLVLAAMDLTKEERTALLKFLKVIKMSR